VKKGDRASRKGGGSFMRGGVKKKKNCGFARHEEEKKREKKRSPAYTRTSAANALSRAPKKRNQEFRSADVVQFGTKKMG